VNRWDRERADHVFGDTVGLVGPIIRSRAVDSEAEENRASEALDELDEVRCPTCGKRFPSLAAACPVEGAPFVSRAAEVHAERAHLPRRDG
jgi:hypothetical protein